MTSKKNTATGPVGHGSAVVNDPVAAILAENTRRNAEINAKFNPVTGEGSIGERTLVEISDFPFSRQWLPVQMMNIPLVKQLVRCGSVAKFLEQEMDCDNTDEAFEAVVMQFVRMRCRYDFPFWAAVYVFIKPKGGGEDVHFKLNRPQRKLIKRLEAMRLAGKPIRLVLLKARQWGGSTATQLYMAWLQLVHKHGLNSLIVGHVKDSSTEVKDMFDRMIEHYPVGMMYRMGEQYDEREPKLVGVGKTGNIQRIPQRNCKIKIGTAEKPNSARGGDYNLVHLTEVGLWKATEGKTPEEIVRSATSGMLYKPYTMVVYESTANGTGNFFHKEYLAAKNGRSQYEALFISWYEIEQNATPFESEKQLAEFAKWLFDNRENESVGSDREEPGTYLWRLWTCGATLEAINWYILERSKYSDHGDMASECPSNDIEAFTFSGRKVFADEDIEKLRPSCRPPRYVGEIYGKWDSGAGALENLQFRKEKNGRLCIWSDVEHDEPDEKVLNRYLVVVDVCKGMSAKADFAVITVFDRIWMIDGDPPSVVAQWRGHIEMDRLAWKAAQVAEYYNHALLVIESNTLETNNTRSEAEYILNLVSDVYDNLYARKSDNTNTDVREKPPVKYGWHTNKLTKGTIIHNLKAVVREQLYTESDEMCLDEYAVYVETENGGFEAPDGYHDDILMTRAIGMWICYHEMDWPRIVNYSSVQQTYHKPINEASIC
ncbi:MAG: terminase [Bacteroidales bacterium]|nr:terminase [Bacteroidales bacterium]